MSEEAAHAEVIQILSRTGMHGEVTQVQVRILDGPNKDAVLTRNIYGSVKIGDIILILEPTREAKRLEAR